MPTTDAATLSRRLLWDEVVALDHLCALVLSTEDALDLLTPADLDRLDRQLRRVLLRVSHLHEARASVASEEVASG
jgi:hypothetical protein